MTRRLEVIFMKKLFCIGVIGTDAAVGLRRRKHIFAGER